MTTFSFSIKEFCEKTQANVDQINRAVALDLLKKVVMKSPVLLGWLRGNWQVGQNNQLVVGTIERKDPSGQETIAAGSAVIGGLKSGGVIWISNNLPYARRIEYGWSTVKAPAGMVRISMIEIQSEFDNIVNGLNK